MQHTDLELGGQQDSGSAESCRTELERMGGWGGGNGGQANGGTESDGTESYGTESDGTGGRATLPVFILFATSLRPDCCRLLAEIVDRAGVCVCVGSVFDAQSAMTVVSGRTCG